MKHISIVKSCMGNDKNMDFDTKISESLFIYLKKKKEKEKETAPLITCHNQVILHPIMNIND